MFYGGFGSYAIGLHEVHGEPGKVYAVSEWSLQQKVTFNHFGYSDSPTDVDGFRRCPPPGVVPGKDTDRKRAIREWQTRLFRQEVGDDDQGEHYRITSSFKRAVVRVADTSA